MLRVTSTIKRRGKVIGRATASGEDGSAEPFRRSAVLDAFTLLFIVPGSMMVSLLYAGIRGRGFSTSLPYLIVMFAGSGFGALWLFKLFGTFNNSMIGCGYGTATAGAWILLHHLIESQKRRDIVAVRNGLPLLPSLDQTTTVTSGLVNKLRDELP